MITINPNKSRTFTFKVAVSGSSTPPVARFVLPMKDNSSVMYKAIVEGDVVKVEMPALKNIYKELLGEAKLELIVGEYYFSPWEGQFEFKEEPQIESVKLEGEEESKPSKPKVSMNEKDIKDSGVESEVKKSLKRTKAVLMEEPKKVEPKEEPKPVEAPPVVKKPSPLRTIFKF